MSRRFRIERRGRRPKPKNRERAPAPDLGTPELRAMKRRLTRNPDLELTSIDVLFGRGLIDAEQRDVLGEVASTVRMLAYNLGPVPEAVARIWRQLTGAMIPAGQGGAQGVGPVADIARRRMRRILSRLNGSRDLVLALADGRRVPRLVEHVLAGRLDYADLAALERLRCALDDLDKGARRPARSRPASPA
jgi:hypothetical protein